MSANILEKSYIFKGWAASGFIQKEIGIIKIIVFRNENNVVINCKSFPQKTLILKIIYYFCIQKYSLTGSRTLLTSIADEVNRLSDI